LGSSPGTARHGFPTSSPGSDFIAAIFKNGSSIYSSWQSGAPTFLATATLVPKEFALTASDQITLQAQPNAAGISTGNSNGNGPFLRIKRV
jgi:hypothetical protein